MRRGIFLSHSKRDGKFATKLFSNLKDAGAAVWMDVAEIQVGEVLLQKIKDGINSFEYLAVLLSPHAVQADWVKRELEIALQAESETGKIKVVPLLLSDCDMPDSLRGRLYADFRDPRLYEDSLQKLIALLGIPFDRPTAIRIVRAGQCSRWNSSRAENPDWEPNLSKAHLGSENLELFNFSGVNLKDADLSETVLEAGADAVDLQGARYNLETKFPPGFFPEDHGAVLEEN